MNRGSDFGSVNDRVFLPEDDTKRTLGPSIARFLSSIRFMFSSYFMSSWSDSRFKRIVSLDSSNSSSCVYVLIVLGALGGLSLFFSSANFFRATTAAVTFFVLALKLGRSELRGGTGIYTRFAGVPSSVLSFGVSLLDVFVFAALRFSAASFFAFNNAGSLYTFLFFVLSSFTFTGAAPSFASGTGSASSKSESTSSSPDSSSLLPNDSSSF